jgi:maltose-binding protein MalE
MPQPDPFHTYPFMSAMGGYVFGRKDGKLNAQDIGLNNEGAINGLKKLDSLYEDNLVPYVGYQTMMSLFKNGDAAMMVTGPWAFSGLNKAGINFGFTQLPKMEGQAPKPFSSIQGFMISSFSKNKMLAQAFIRDFIARKDTMLELYEKTNRPPVYKPAMEVANENPLTAGVLKSAKSSMPMPSIPEMNSVWAAWKDTLELVLNQKQDVKPALDNAVKQIKTSIEKSNK